MKYGILKSITLWSACIKYHRGPWRYTISRAEIVQGHLKFTFTFQVKSFWLVNVIKPSFFTALCLFFYGLFNQSLTFISQGHHNNSHCQEILAFPFKFKKNLLGNVLDESQKQMKIIVVMLKNHTIYLNSN